MRGPFGRIDALAIDRFDVTRRRVLAASTVAFCTPVISQVGMFPSRTVTLTVPWPPGNSIDLLARLLAPGLAEQFGRPVVVENTVGASGMIGVQKLLNEAPDGHTILVGSSTEMLVTPLTMAAARFASRDLRLVAFLGRAPYALLGRPDLPAGDLRELLTWARRPGAPALNIGGAGLNSLTAARFAQLSGLDTVRISYRGQQAILQDLQGSRIDLAFLPMVSNIMPLIDQGKLRFFGITASAPLAELKRFATMGSMDPVFRAFDANAWAGLALPRAGLSEAVAERIREAFDAVRARPSIRPVLDASGMVLAEPMSLPDLDRFYLAEVARYEALAASIGLRPA